MAEPLLRTIAAQIQAAIPGADLGKPEEIGQLFSSFQRYLEESST